MYHDLDKPKGDWKKGLFACFDSGIENCLYGCCCPICAAATARTNHDGSGWETNYFLIGVVGNYNLIRQDKNIEGGYCTDILAGLCCEGCAAVRLLQETEGDRLDKKQWSHGLCDVCAAGPGMFCISFMCCYCALVTANARAEFDSSGLKGLLFNWCCVPCCGNYNLVRTGSGIEGGWFGDLLRMTFCGPCAAIQATAEVRNQ